MKLKERLKSFNQGLLPDKIKLKYEAMAEEENHYRKSGSRQLKTK
ncbi:hypothetical protein [Mucilaginibacter rubeus]|nr:hypothetical protein [Mucilaginibacter rubeus]